MSHVPHHATMTTAGRDGSAPDALSHAQVEPVTQRQRRRLRRYGNEPRASKPYIRRPRGLWGQKLASKPASTWGGTLSGGDLIILQKSVRCGGPQNRALRAIICQAVIRTVVTSKPRKSISAVSVIVDMHGADVSATTSLKD